ncbi:ATP synthase gamma chain, chloroplastic [Coccomyxa sp. Obi]|nr:ATP synthase gamma chain, chloroplastic [Coccomyxa sp. Obi]
MASYSAAMGCGQISGSVRSKAFQGDASLLAHKRAAPLQQRAALQVCAGLKDTRDRINSVKNTQKITDAMKLVAAAKVRRAQDAVVNGRPFSENLVKVLYGVNQRLRVEDVDSPLVNVRPVKSVLLVIVTGDRGLCGGYNNFVIKKAEARNRELRALGVDVKLVTVGKKGEKYFKRRSDQYNIIATYDLGATPTTKEAQAVADELYADFVSEEVDKVEMIYTKFVSLISSDPVVQTLLPLTPQGEICDIEGRCVDAGDDELFKLTTKEGKLTLEREKVTMDTSDFDAGLIFEQDPVQIIDALLPLYLNSTLLRSLQEALASELAARMNAMNSASDNARDLRKKLTLQYNRKRQAMITSQIIEIVSGANA